jgi:hypothetical protein
LSEFQQDIFSGEKEMISLYDSDDEMRDKLTQRMVRASASSVDLKKLRNVETEESKKAKELKAKEEREALEREAKERLEEENRLKKEAEDREAKLAQEKLLKE